MPKSSGSGQTSLLPKSGVKELWYQEGTNPPRALCLVGNISKIAIACLYILHSLAPAIPAPHRLPGIGVGLGFGAVFESKRWVLHSKSSTRLGYSIDRVLMASLEWGTFATPFASETCGGTRELLVFMYNFDMTLFSLLPPFREKWDGKR